MEQDNIPPRIPPPNSKDTIRSQKGSFFRKNWWIFLIVGGVALFGLAGWYVVSRVRRVIRRYETFTRPQDTLIKEVDTVYKEVYDPSVKTAKLIMQGGTATYRLSETTDHLFTADAKLHHHIRYEVKSYNEYSDHVIDFAMKDEYARDNFWGNGNKTDSITFKLNSAPVWEIKVNTGATDLDFDLSKFKVKDLSLNGGAAQLVLKMGSPLTDSNITIQTGAADVTINVPHDAACSIEMSSALSSTTFDGFTKKDANEYQTANFASAKKKYHIYISGGVSDYKIHQY